MSNYNHTASDALSLAATCEKRASSGTGVALNPSATDMVAKALKFWAEHQPYMFKKGDNIVPLPQGGISELSKVYEVKADVLLVAVLESDAVNATYFRIATPEEEAAGHRIDENLTSGVQGG